MRHWTRIRISNQDPRSKSHLLKSKVQLMFKIYNSYNYQNLQYGNQISTKAKRIVLTIIIKVVCLIGTK